MNLDEVSAGLRRKHERWRMRHVWARDIKDNQHLTLLMTALLGPSDTFVDVGSNEGIFLAAASRIAPDGSHVAYEPLPELAADLRRTYPDVTVVEAALAAFPGTSDFSHVTTGTGLSGLRARPLGRHEARTITVEVATLDTSLPPGVRPTLIKIDVEGAELGVLQGGMETLREHRPVVAFEHQKGASEFFGTTPEDVHGLLAGDLGYRIFDIDGGGPHSRSDFRRLYDEHAIWNFVALA